MYYRQSQIHFERGLDVPSLTMFLLPPQILIEHLVCAKPCFRCWEYNDKKNSYNLFLWSIQASQGADTKKQKTYAQELCSRNKCFERKEASTSGSRL
jgi:hypothetical protein